MGVNLFYSTRPLHVISNPLLQKGSLLDWRRLIISWLPYLFLTLALLLLMVTGLSAQNNNWLKATETLEGDTLFRSGLSAVTITADRHFDDERVRTEYYRIVTLRRDVERVAPFAQEASLLLSNLDNALSATQDRKARQKLIKAREGQIQLKVEARLQQLTRQQGEVMVKLIHRETGQTVHYWMQSIKGKASAFYWQNLARTGGVNLKAEYDPTGTDREVERILTGKPY